MVNEFLSRLGGRAEKPAPIPTPGPRRRRRSHPQGERRVARPRAAAQVQKREIGRRIAALERDLAATEERGEGQPAPFWSAFRNAAARAFAPRRGPVWTPGVSGASLALQAPEAWSRQEAGPASTGRRSRVTSGTGSAATAPTARPTRSSPESR